MDKEILCSGSFIKANNNNVALLLTCSNAKHPFPPDGDIFIVIRTKFDSVQTYGNARIYKSDNVHKILVDLQNLNAVPAEDSEYMVKIL